MAEDRTLLALIRIAAALGVSVDAFHAGYAQGSERDALRAQMDAVEMQRAFAAITDPAKRRACIDFVRRAASEGHSE